MIYPSIRQMNKLLGQLDTWLVKATEYAQKKSFDVNTLLVFRLAPDQYPFVRQVQLSCDHAKFAPARLTGKEAPKHPDDEQTIESLPFFLVSFNVRRFIVFSPFCSDSGAPRQPI